MSSPKLDATSWTLIGILSILWGSAFLLIKVGMESFSFNTLVFLRLALAVPPMLIAMRLAGHSSPRDMKSWWMLAVVGALNCALPFMLFFWGMQYIESGYSSVLNATTPLWGVVIAHFMTDDEKITSSRILGVLLGMAGIVVMAWPDAVKGLTGNFLAQLACLVSTLFYSIAAIYGRRLSQTAMAPMVVATGQTMAAALIMLPVMLIFDQPWTMPTPSLESTAAALTLALLSTALAYILFFRLIDRSGASNAQLVAFLMPILAVILGMAFLGESLSERQIAGAILIALGLVAIDGRLFSRSAPQTS